MYKFLEREAESETLVWATIGGTEGLLVTAGFGKTTEVLVCVIMMKLDEQVRMPEGSEFLTEEAATLKPREAKVVRSADPKNRQPALEERRE